MVEEVTPFRPRPFVANDASGVNGGITKDDFIDYFRQSFGQAIGMEILSEQRAAIARAHAGDDAQVRERIEFCWFDVHSWPDTYVAEKLAALVPHLEEPVGLEEDIASLTETLNELVELKVLKKTPPYRFDEVQKLVDDSLRSTSIKLFHTNIFESRNIHR